MIPSHHLHKEDAVVGVGGVTDLVHAFHDGIEGAVVADGGVCAVEVVVDGAGQSDDGEVELHTEVPGTGERAVAADDYEGVDFLSLAGLISFLHTFEGHELLASGSLQYSTASRDDAADILGGEGFHFALDESVVATVDAFDVKIVVDACARHGADSCVHTWRVAARGQNTNCLNPVHSRFSLFC